VAALTLGTDGNFYGTTLYGGWWNQGSVFRIATNGDYTLLASLGTGNIPSLLGINCFAQLVQAADGAFYGVAQQQGVSASDEYPYPPEWNGDGTIFRVTAAGDLTTVYSFGSSMFAGLPVDGAYPCVGMIQVGAGNLYGTTFAGGLGPNDGTIFRLTIPPPPPPLFQSVTKSGATTSLTWSATWGVQYQLQYKDDFNSPFWLNLGPILTTTNSSITAYDSGATAQRFYRVDIPW
jgi:uncharacterized repeat protein (TIGR03803 family)